MGIHIQRKCFEAEVLAREAAAGFLDPQFKIPGIKVAATYREEAGAWWVYVTQAGDIVTGQEPTLPDYERVA